MVPPVENELEKFGATAPNGVTTVVDDSKSADVPNLKGDWHNILFLLLLYTMQGLVVGINIGMPVLLQINNMVTFKDQALFSLVVLPYSLKLIWAPLVDALYVKKMGRRKSWLLPVQYLMGACFIYMAYNIDEWLPETGKPDILKLLYVVFFIQCLNATQDIIVDGWALTMLNRNNVGYASTCNEIGAKLGMIIGTLSIVLFTSDNFSDNYLRSTPGAGKIVTKENLFYIWGIQFTFITTLIAIFKKEKDNRIERDYTKISIIQNYLLLWNSLKLPSIQVLMIALFTVEAGLATTNNKIIVLKLIESGVPKDNITVIDIAMQVIKIIIPIIVSKYTAGLKPMSVYLKALPIRLFWSIPFAVVVYYTTTFKPINETIHFPIHYYLILVFVFMVNNVLTTITAVAKIAFYSRISDPRFGGTYMTLFCTFPNLGFSLWSSVSIAMIDFLTFKECTLDFNNNCSTSSLKNTCKTKGGNCIISVNGYFVETAVCLLFGIVWYCIFKSILKNAQVKKSSQWMVDVKKSVKKNKTNEYSVVAM